MENQNYEQNKIQTPGAEARALTQHQRRKLLAGEIAALRKEAMHSAAGEAKLWELKAQYAALLTERRR